MGKDNQITSEGYNSDGQPTDDRLTAEQAFGVVEAHKGCIQKASPVAWDKIEVYFERFRQMEDELRTVKLKLGTNLEPSLDNMPIEDVRKAVIGTLKSCVDMVSVYTQKPTRQPHVHEVAAMKALVSVVRRYLKGIKNG